MEHCFVKLGLNINCDISRTVENSRRKFCTFSNLYDRFKCTKFVKYLRCSGAKCLKYWFIWHRIALTSYLKKHSIKNHQKFCLCTPTGNRYFPPCFNISGRNFLPIFLNRKTTKNLLANVFNLLDQTLKQIASGNHEGKNNQNLHFWSFLVKKKN